MATLKVQKLVPNAVIPTRGTPGAAGYDLYSTDGFIIMPGHRVVIPTGVAVELPAGTYGRIAPRSGLAVKHGVDVLAGVVAQSAEIARHAAGLIRIEYDILEPVTDPVLSERSRAGLRLPRCEVRPPERAFAVHPALRMQVLARWG